MRLVKACAYPSIGGSRGGTRGGAAPSLVLDQTYGRRVEKLFFGHRTPRLPQGLDDPGPPPYLKVWIRHYQRQFEFHEDEQIKHLQIQLAWFLVLVKVFWGGGGSKEAAYSGVL